MNDERGIDPEEQRRLFQQFCEDAGMVQKGVPLLFNTAAKAMADAASKLRAHDASVLNAKVEGMSEAQLAGAAAALGLEAGQLAVTAKMGGDPYALGRFLAGKKAAGR